MKKTTNKEFFEMIADYMKDNADIVGFCQKQIAALDKKSEKAKARAAEKKAKGDELLKAVKDILTAEPQSTAEVTAKVCVTYPEATAAKCSYRLTKLVKDGIAGKAEETIKVKDGRNRKIMTYYIEG